MLILDDAKSVKYCVIPKNGIISRPRIQRVINANLTLRFAGVFPVNNHL